MKAFVQRYLDPIDALLELIYGVLVIMTFTMAANAFNLPSELESLFGFSGNALLLAAFGCAIAWGFIDASVYVMSSVGVRNQRRRILRSVQDAPDDETRIALLTDAFDDDLTALAPGDERTAFYARSLPRVQTGDFKRSHIRAEDLKGGATILLIAFVATLPVVIPILFIRNADWAMHTANALCLVMLYAAGSYWGKLTGSRPVPMGLTISGVGLLLVLLAIPLGG
jgi:VIT1/CCC1 family predicted Fe2+/Mn2+ transporter